MRQATVTAVCCGGCLAVRVRSRNQTVHPCGVPVEPPHSSYHFKSMNNRTQHLGEASRMTRLLSIIQMIRSDPHQTLSRLVANLGISRSQFYKDKEALKKAGFDFVYRKTSGFHITEDRFTPLTDLSLSDRIILMFALEHMSTSGDGMLAARAVEVGRKLAGGLDSPFREHLLSCFDENVTEKTFGVRPEIFSALTQAVSDGCRIKILYQRSEDWTTRWREIDPKRIYMRQKTLYLYARTVDENEFQWKVFRLSRIQQIRFTGVSVTWRPDADDGFLERQRNAFQTFLGTETYPVSIRFTGNAVHYVLEQKWHSSQQLVKNTDGSITVTFQVAEPQEVIRWARQFGSDAEVVEQDVPEKG